MKLSCCSWALDEGRGPLRIWRRFRGQRVAEANSLKQLADLGFKTVDVSPFMQKSAEARTALKTKELNVACVSISHEAPKGSTFDSENLDRVNSLVKHTNEGVVHASEIGAAWTYVVPGPPVDEGTISRYGVRYSALAEHAQDYGVKLCIEHFPGSAFPTVAATLDFIKDVNHPNLYLLFDIGHAQMTNEDPAELLPLAGDRLAYVHLDDNDGVSDLHLALTDGLQTHESLENLFKVLQDVGYDGPVSLEMKQTLPNPLDAIRRSKKIVERFINVQ